jgi:quinol monooxygenase YgiN
MFHAQAQSKQSEKRELMIIIAGTIHFNPQDRQATLDAIQRMMDASRAEEGCLAYTFSADLASPDTLHLFEVWTSAEALELHRQTPHMAAFRQEVSPSFAQTKIKKYTGEELQ